MNSKPIRKRPTTAGSRLLDTAGGYPPRPWPGRAGSAFARPRGSAEGDREAARDRLAVRAHGDGGGEAARLHPAPAEVHRERPGAAGEARAPERPDLPGAPQQSHLDDGRLVQGDAHALAEERD